MSLLDRLINGKRTITEPTFLKEFEENQELNALKDLSNKVKSDKKNKVDKDIYFLKQELYGEKNIYNELKNSFIPMLAIHDIKFEYNDYIAEYDFIIITTKCIFILKTKQLNGDIEITEDGDFVRIIKNREGKFLRRQGMYNPISLNERHTSILKELLQKEKSLANIPVKSVVVISNPKTIINKSKCPQNIKDNLFKYDQIGSLIKRILEDEKSSKEVPEKNMYEAANYLIENNKEEIVDYMAKYSLKQEDFIDESLRGNSKIAINSKDNEVPEVNAKIEDKQDETIQSNDNTNTNRSPSSNDNTEVFELLRQYRLKTSREEGFKPYMVFNNEELNSLIENKPENKDELLKIKGFGPKKVEKYGEAIITILNNITTKG